MQLGKDWRQHGEMKVILPEQASTVRSFSKTKMTKLSDSIFKTSAKIKKQHRLADQKLPKIKAA